MKVTAKHKYATAGFVYLFGLICASFLESTACFIVFAVMTAVFGFSLNKSEAFVQLVIALIGGAFLVFGLYRAVYIEPCKALAGTRGKVSAVVTGSRAPDNDIVLLTLSGTANEKAVKLTLFTADKGIAVGDRVEFDAVFSAFSDYAEFSESSYYFSKEIFLKAYAVSEIQVTEGSAGVNGLVTGLSDYLRGRLDNYYSGTGGGIVKAMFFGDKSGLSDRTRTDITRSGISHLTAVSGMHLSLLVHGFAGILTFFIRKGGRLYFWVITLYILFLMLFFGMSASVMRSGFMMIVYYASRQLYRRTQVVSSVGAALLVILAVNPCACRDTGLILSVLGTLGVGAVAPKARELLSGRGGFLGNALISSVCASLCTMPVGALCFGGISFAAPVTCLLVQPFFTLILTLVPFALIFPFFTEPFLLIAGLSARAMELIASFTGGFGFSYISADGEAVVIFALLLLSGGILTMLVTGRLKPVAVFAAFMTAAFAVSQALYGIISFDDIKITITADSSDTVLRVEDKTGVSFYALTAGSDAADLIYGQSAGSAPKFICIAEGAANRGGLSALCGDIHFPEEGGMRYDISGEYSAVVYDGEIILDIRGITIGLLPAGSGTQCDISVYCGYEENYGCGGKTATILCDKKYYNCGEAVNAFLYKTEIVINPEGMYALSVK